MKYIMSPPTLVVALVLAACGRQPPTSAGQQRAMSAEGRGVMGSLGSSSALDGSNAVASCFAPHAWRPGHEPGSMSAVIYDLHSSSMLDPWRDCVTHAFLGSGAATDQIPTFKAVDVPSTGQSGPGFDAWLTRQFPLGGGHVISSPYPMVGNYQARSLTDILLDAAALAYPHSISTQYRNPIVVNDPSKQAQSEYVKLLYKVCLGKDASREDIQDYEEKMTYYAGGSLVAPGVAARQICAGTEDPRTRRPSSDVALRFTATFLQKRNYPDRSLATVEREAKTHELADYDSRLLSMYDTILQRIFTTPGL